MEIDRTRKFFFAVVGIAIIYIFIWVFFLRSSPMQIDPTGIPISYTIKSVTVTPFITPSPTREVIARINLVDKKLDDGSIQTVAELSIEPLSVGTFDVTASKLMTVSNPSLITLVIDPSSGLFELTRTPVDSSTDIPGDPDHILRVSDELEIYPVMTADLSSASEDFKIENMDQATKPMLSGKLTTWKWQVTPKKPGDNWLFLQISIPIEYAGQIVENAQMVAQKELPVQVKARPTITPKPTKIPTPTPTFGRRITTGAQDNAFYLVVGMLLIGIVIVVLWWTMKQFRAKQFSSFDVPSAEGHTSEQLTQLLWLIDDKFNEGELQILCFNMSIKYDNLPATGKVYKARELIEYCIQTKRINELIDEAEKMRPGSIWSEIRA